MPDPRPLVYLAGPYTQGDPAINTRCQLELADWLMDTGLAWPVAPLVSHFQHTMFPRAYEDWLALDLALLSRCDGLIRYDAVNMWLNYAQSASSGADREMAHAESLRIPALRVCGDWDNSTPRTAIESFVRGLRPRVLAHPLAAPGGEVPAVPAEKGHMP